jgi:hypothetical protein
VLDEEEVALLEAREDLEKHGRRREVHRELALLLAQLREGHGRERRARRHARSDDGDDIDLVRRAPGLEGRAALALDARAHLRLARRAERLPLCGARGERRLAPLLALPLLRRALRRDPVVRRDGVEERPLRLLLLEELAQARLFRRDDGEEVAQALELSRLVRL